LNYPGFGINRGVSCIPAGRYGAHLRYDKPDGWRIQLNTVLKKRSGIQIHIGNYPRQTEGCILVGMSYGPNSVDNSTKAYKNLQKAFYGTDSPNSTPDKAINVELKGILSMPWGDFSSPYSITA
jgi:hypothetical protein